MRHLLIVGRSLKLLGDDATEYLQRPLALRFGKILPELRESYPRTRGRRRWKKVPSRRSGMVLLLVLGYDKPRTKRRASTKHKARLLEKQMRVDSSQLGGSYVCSFWGAGMR